MSEFISETGRAAKGRALTKNECRMIELEYRQWSDNEIRELRARVAELEHENESLWETFVKVSDYLGVDNKAARKIPGKPSNVFRSAILRKQAEAVIPAMMITAREFGRPDITYSAMRIFAEEYAQRLHQQADEAERVEGKNV